MELPKYFGRGIVLGMDSDGVATAGYFVTGRSDSSRSRILVRDGQRIFTESTKPLREEDNPDLLIYDAMVWKARVPGYRDGIVAVSNGKQTHQVMGRWYASKQDITESLNDWNYEPDKGNNTARISGRILLPEDGMNPSLELGIIRRGEGSSPLAEREQWIFRATRGVGYLLTTYRGNAPEGERLPPFVGQPQKVSLEDAITMSSMLATLHDLAGDPGLFVAAAVVKCDPGLFTADILLR
ncbi:MAG TPA: IMP cyclohydrolase [Candidatus Nanoarchaeia archaeon]|nr:IMP cyclohydrolase [Candidatus Nanoarchaeia archaeon]